MYEKFSASFGNYVPSKLDIILIIKNQQHEDKIVNWQRIQKPNHSRGSCHQLNLALIMGKLILFQKEREKEWESKKGTGYCLGNMVLSLSRIIETDANFRIIWQPRSNMVTEEDPKGGFRSRRYRQLVCHIIFSNKTQKPKWFGYNVSTKNLK